MVTYFGTPFERLLSLQDALERAMNFDYFGLSTSNRAGFPPIDVFKDGEDLVLKAEIPGVKKEDVNVEIKEEQIRIHGERKPDFQAAEVSVHRLERPYDRFDRTFTLPFRVDDRGIKAKFEDGVLTVRLPQAETDKPRKIAIN